MNHLRYALIGSVLVAGSAMAQRVVQRAPMYQLGPAEQTAARPILLPAEAGDLRDGGDVVWSEDFANGLAGNNGVGEWTTGGPNGDLWQYDTDGPNGDFSSTAQRIQSSTVGNGFMIFDSNLSNNGCVDTDTCMDREGSLISPVIDLSATPFVELVWMQRMRYCCGANSPHFVEVSTDGGATWPTRLAAAATLVGNDDPGTVTQKVNIAGAISADPSNVRFRFFHEGTSSHYHWQVDDVRIVELFAYDMRVSASGLTQWDPNTAATYDSLRYSVLPYSQLRPLGLNMTVLNNGSATQTSAVANFTVTRGGTTVLDQDQPQADLVPGEERVIYVDPGFTPPAEEGTYQVAYSIDSDETDETPADNVGSASFAVSPFVYSRDRGSVASTQAAGQGTLIMANAFYVANSVELHSIQVALGTGSELGSLVVGELRLDDLETVVATSDEVIVTSSMLTPNGGSSVVNLIFNPPVTLDANVDYMAAVQVFGDVRIGRNGTSEPQSSFIFFEGQAGLDWYFTTTTPIIRMSFDPTVGIDELDPTNTLGLGQNLPNPANVSTTIPYELKETGEVNFEVHDVTGKLVFEQYMGTRAPGVYRFDLSLENLRDGVYFYTMTAGDARVTKRMIVTR